MRSPTVTTTLQRLAAQAARDPQRVFTPLTPRIEADVLREAYRHTSKTSAAGIDGVTATMYAEHLAENLHDVHARLWSGRSQAVPGERGWSEKDDGGHRPIGQPAFEDTIVQRAVVMVLEAMYEQDCPDGSYGFRPGRSPHEARHELRERCMQEGIGWIVEADGSGYFDSIDRPQLRDVLRQRGNDGRLIRLLGQWLRAGVMEDGVWHHPESGVVQGGVLSPVLANAFRHPVRDAWCERDVRPRLQGRCFLRRFAEDVCLGGELATDARQIMAVRPKRFARFGVTMHPEKTALLPCRQPDGHEASACGNGTCELLGLPHYWAKSRRGCWGIKRRTARKRLCRPKQSLWRGCRPHRHAPWKAPYRMRCAKLRGPFQSYGMRGNFRLLEDVRHACSASWRDWLSRRRRKSAIGWEKFAKLLAT